MAAYRVWIHPIIHGGSTILPSIDGDSFLLIPPGDIVNLGVSTEGDSFMIVPVTEMITPFLAPFPIFVYIYHAIFDHSFYLLD